MLGMAAARPRGADDGRALRRSAAGQARRRRRTARRGTLGLHLSGECLQPHPEPPKRERGSTPRSSIGYAYPRSGHRVEASAVVLVSIFVGGHPVGALIL